MRTKSIAVTLLMATAIAGCSSISVPSLSSLPSLPSMPWSHPAVKPDPTAEALFEEGTRYFNDKRYARAIDAFTKLKTDHPFTPLLTETELKVADAYYLNQQYPEAINAFKEFQSMHPSNENLAFVVYRLGQAHFDQFTSTDRDQKSTETARGYFETVITNYPQSPYAVQAKEKLVKCIEYLAEYDFNVASFYLQQAKYAAARDRFEEIVRKYRGTPAAAKSLFFLGESYRKEKNNVKAGLAYEALIQHYPQSKFAPEARNQLAQIERDKQDPLAMLLMRDRRPGALSPEANQEIASNTKLKDINNLVAKTEWVYEESGTEKGFFRRVVDKINPFSSSDDGKKDDGKKKEEKKPESGIELLAGRKASEKQESPGLLASFWNGINPFSGRNPADRKTAIANNGQLVNQIDDSLKQKGIDSNTQMAALKPPSGEMPKEDPPPQTMDTEKLLGNIDANLQKGGKNIAELPEPPEAAEVFRDSTAARAIVAKAAAQSESAINSSPPSVINSGLLSSIDQKLKSQGLEPSKFELPPVVAEAKPDPSARERSKKVELEPKLPMEKGPLYLSPSEVQTQDNANPSQESVNQEKKPESPNDKPQEPAVREIPRALVKGPSQPQPAAVAKATEQKKPAPGEEEENKGVIDQLKQNLEDISKVLNPFRW
jgi:outer membrane protein assembly factor BamD